MVYIDEDLLNSACQILGVAPTVGSMTYFLIISAPILLATWRPLSTAYGTSGNH